MHIFFRSSQRVSAWRWITVLPLMIAFAGSAFAEGMGPEALDARVSSFMLKWGVRDGSVAIVRGGKLVHSQQFERTYRRAVNTSQSPKRFRIGSLSKPVTAGAVLRLVEQGAFTLETPVFELLPHFTPFVGDERMQRIQIRHLLQHASGWNPAVSGDPVFPSHQEIREAGGSFPPTHEELIAYWLARPLDSEPGSQYAYSNFGFMLLARVVESVTGEAYPDWVRRQLMEPLQIQQTRIGASLWPDVLRGEEGLLPEAVYIALQQPRIVPSIFSAEIHPVLEPYGGYSMELFDGAGGWVSTSADLGRFFAALTGDRDPFLSAETRELLTARMPFDDNQPYWSGMGVGVIETPDGFVLSHAGQLPGSISRWIRLPDGTHVVALFNTTVQEARSDKFSEELDLSLLQGFSEVAEWPDVDLFGSAVSANTGAAPMHMRGLTTAGGRPLPGPVASELEFVSGSEWEMGEIATGQLVDDWAGNDLPR